MVLGAVIDDYSELAARVAAGVDGLRGCLILSRDGLVLGAHPHGDESVAKPSWLRFAALGEPERSFVEYGDQIWAYVHRGSYTAFAVADAGVRPGLMLDRLEQVLLMAEESRARREALPALEAAIPAGPRSPLHPPTPTVTPAPAVATAPSPPGVDGEPHQTRPWPRTKADPPGTASTEAEDAEIDRVLLAREFVGLLQELPANDEGST